MSSMPPSTPLETRYVSALLGLAEAPPDRATLLDVLDATLEAIDGERAFLFAFRKTGGFRALAARDRDREDISGPLDRMSHYAIGKMFETGSVLHVADARQDRRFRTGDALAGRRASISIVVIPLHVDGELTGGVYVDHRFRQLEPDVASAESVERWIGLCAVALARREDAKRIRRLEKGAGARSTAAAALAVEAPAPRTADATRRAAADDSDLREFHGLESANPDMLDLFDTVDSLRDSDIPIVICGETGTGKGQLARAVHLASRRADGAFVPVSCGSIPESLVESELLGHARGAFTGAEVDRVGLLVQAHGGTLLLDEVGDMSDAMQRQLLRVLEDGIVRPLGGKDTVEVDLRVVAATSCDLAARMADGRFRRDLYFRLKGIDLELPPLRERWEDVPGLAQRILVACAEGREPARLRPEVVERLAHYAWPGNVRELANEMRRLAALGLKEVGLRDLSAPLRGARAGPYAPTSATPPPLDDVIADAERAAIERALDRCGGNKSRTAEELGITRKALYRRLAKYGMG